MSEKFSAALGEIVIHHAIYETPCCGVRGVYSWEEVGVVVGGVIRRWGFICPACHKGFRPEEAGGDAGGNEALGG